MPRQPSPAARFGTRFHAWVESRVGQQGPLDPTTCRAAATRASTTTPSLQELIHTFEAGPFADRILHAVEVPFALVLRGQVVRGRIDAVYAEPSADGDELAVVDRKTNRSPGPTRGSSPSTGWRGPSSWACPWSG